MQWKSRRTMLTALVVVLLLSLGVVAVFAQGDTTPGTDERPARPLIPFGRGGFDRGLHGRDFGGANDEALAEALGISIEALQAARQKVAADRLAQAVEAGTITQDQANTRLAMRALKSVLDRQEILAEALGLSTDELSAAREDRSLRDLLATVTPAELQENLQAATAAAVQQAVADNVITQDQADLVLEQLENGFGLGKRLDGHRGFGGGRGRSHGFRGAPAPDTQNGEAFAPFRIPFNAPA